MKENNENILVSISCITYNHAKFIRQALDGFLMQEPPACVQSSVVSLQSSVVSRQEPWFEILIHDDCSTDGTIEILKEYEAKYPDIMNVVYETENQYSKGGPWGSAVWNYPRARGKYIALCEGDDYWTDPLKLQKQVVFMEAHPEYSVCFTDYRNYNIYTEQYLEPEYTRLMRERGDEDGMDLDIDTMFRRWVTMPLTELLRADAMDLNLVHQYKHYRDLHESYHLMRNGKCRLMNFVGAVRNQHDGGVSSLIAPAKQVEINLPIQQELYLHNKDQYTKENYIRGLKWALGYCNPWSLTRLRYSWSLLKLNRDLIQFIKNIKRK